MMRSLFELQELDLETDRCRAELASVEARLKDDTELVEARERLSIHEAQARQTKVQQGSQDIEVKALQAKAQALEQRLYGGSVRNPKELESGQAELNFAKEQMSNGEDALLSLMLALDEAERQVAQDRSTLDKVEAEVSEARKFLTGERSTLVQRLEELTARRQKMSQGIVPPVLAEYDRLRRTHRGQAVAKVERGMCTGCRLTLPTKEVQRVRTAKEAVMCASCGRILYVS